MFDKIPNNLLTGDMVNELMSMNENNLQRIMFHLDMVQQHTGEITLEDVKYCLDLNNRILNKIAEKTEKNEPEQPLEKEIVPGLDNGYVDDILDHIRDSFSPDEPVPSDINLSYHIMEITYNEGISLEQLKILIDMAKNMWK